ncbi:MAG: hypothetical protein ABGX32_07025 [Methylococcales bacterium]
MLRGVVASLIGVAFIVNINGVEECGIVGIAINEGVFANLDSISLFKVLSVDLFIVYTRWKLFRCAFDIVFV